MTSMIKLKGMTWDHVRGINPLITASKHFNEFYPNISITWEARSLEDFEDFPIDILAKTYDLLMIDHPFIGTGVENHILEPLNRWLSETFLIEQEKNSVGKSFESYTWDNKQWALAADAAAQVSAYRPDLLEQLQVTLPKTWDDVLSFASELPDQFKIGFPLNDTHSFCCFISLGANIGGDKFYKDGEGFNEAISTKALALLLKLKQKAHPMSIDSNPIHILNFMATENDIIYSPLLFGYSNYSKNNYKKHQITFTNIPSFKAEPVGSILGGVGIALSAKSKAKEAATKFIEYVMSKDCQVNLFVEADGQPGYLKAWESENNNNLTNNFFRNTLNTVELAYVRPRYNGYSEFQMKAGKLIRLYLKQNDVSQAADTVKALNEWHIKTYSTIKR